MYNLNDLKFSIYATANEDLAHLLELIEYALDETLFEKKLEILIIYDNLL